MGYGPKKGYWVSAVGQDFPAKRNPWPAGKMDEWLSKVPELEIVDGAKGKRTIQFVSAGYAASLIASHAQGPFEDPARLADSIASVLAELELAQQGGKRGRGTVKI